MIVGLGAWLRNSLRGPVREHVLYFVAADHMVSYWPCVLAVSPCGRGKTVAPTRPEKAAPRSYRGAYPLRAAAAPPRLWPPAPLWWPASVPLQGADRPR